MGKGGHICLKGITVDLILMIRHKNNILWEGPEISCRFDMELPKSEKEIATRIVLCRHEKQDTFEVP